LIVKIFELGSSESEKKLFLEIIKAKMLRISEAENMIQVKDESKNLKLWEIY